jgi:DNA-binding response OmpR family regulator
MTDVTGQTARIVVVEDDHVMRRMVLDYLEDHNMRGVSASGRQELARNFVNQHSIRTLPGSAAML